MAAPAMSHLPRISRLRQRAGFLRVKAEGRRVATPAFTLQYLTLPMAEATPATLTMGFTCSKAAISKRAVDRNRARRRLQAAVRLALNEFSPENQPILWLVWVAKLPILTIPFVALQADVTMALTQAGLTPAGLTQAKLSSPPPSV
jgi:ribonuclease P protein component